MKAILTFFCLALLFAACLSEKSASPGNGSTFVRYYSGGYNDEAVAFEETSDKGFIVLGSIRIVTSAAEAPKYRIKLIKTDEFGNPLWQQIWPPFNDPGLNYRARGLQILQNGGYVVTGEDIKSDSSTKILLMTVDGSGTDKPKTLAIKKPASNRISMVGEAVVTNSTGNFLVLGASGNASMILSEVKKDDLSTEKADDFIPLWANAYAAGQTSLTNRMYLDDAGKVFWAGTVTKSLNTGIRFVKTAQNAQNTEFDLQLINPGFSDKAADFCRFGYGYAIIGSTDQKQGNTLPSDRDILFKRLGQDGSLLSTKSFPIVSAEVSAQTATAGSLDDKQDDQGNSISSTQDGGLILLGSVNSTALKTVYPNHVGGDFDFLLIKIDAFGNEVWRTAFGSRFRDMGVTVRQSLDGGYVVLGTTTQGGQDIMVLTKTNKSGKIE